MKIDLLDYDLDQLYSSIDQLKAFEWYLGVTVRPQEAFRNPLRDDHVASASLKFNDEGRLLMMDFADSRYCGDLLRIIMNHENMNFKEAFRKVFSAAKKNEFVGASPGYEKKTYVDKEICNIKVMPQRWTHVDAAYWRQYGINSRTLEENNVQSCKIVIIGEKTYRYASNSPIYSYFITEGIYEIYRPYAKREEKFRYNGNKDIVWGYKSLPENGELLIITKSKKDALFLKQRGFLAICKTGEGVRWQDFLIEALQLRFKKVIIFYDRDQQGVRAVRRLWKNQRLNFFFIPKRFGAKDITDFYKMYGEDETQKLLKCLITR